VSSVADVWVERAERDATRRARRRAADELARRLGEEARRERAERDAHLAAEREARASRERERKQENVRALRRASADVRKLERERLSALEELRREAARVYYGTEEESLVRGAEDRLDRVERDLRRAVAAQAHLASLSI
jgi:hypothetical protein